MLQAIEEIWAIGGTVLLAIVLLTIFAWTVWAYAWVNCKQVERALQLIKPESFYVQMCREIKLLCAVMSVRRVRRAHLQPMLRAHVQGLNSYQRVLQAVVGIMPLLGLLGTVFGLVSAFSNMHSIGAMVDSGLTLGISRALVTTQAGLLSALPLWVAVAVLRKRTSSYQVKIESKLHAVLLKEADNVSVC